MQYIIYDTETTGLPVPDATSLDDQPKIIEYAAVKTDKDFNILDEIEFKCNPNEVLDPFITKLTGITDEMLVNEKPFPFYYKDLCKFHLGVNGLIAHHLEFDRSLMVFELKRMGSLIKFPWPYLHLCTKQLSSNLEGPVNNKLQTLYKFAFNKDFTQEHRAMADVKCLHEYVLWMRDRDMI